MSAAIRITPEMIDFLKKKLTGTSDDSPNTPPKIAPTDYRNQPLETDTTVNSNAPPIRPIQPYEAVPSSFGGSAIPISAPDLTASRERTTQPVSPLLKASENAAAPVLPDFGQDKEGNQRTHAKRGFLGRAEAFAKDLGINMLEGRGLIASAADATHAAINPDILAERRAKVKTAENRQEYGNQIQLAGERQKIQSAQTQTDLEKARIADLQRKPEVEAEKARVKAVKDGQAAVLANARLLKGQKLDPNNPRHAAFLARAERANVFIDPEKWNDSASNEVEATIVDPENPTQTRKVLINKATGEQSDVGQAGYVQPVNRQTGMTPAQTENIKVQREGLGIRREGVDIQREGLGIRRGEVSRQDQEYENRRQGVITANDDIDRRIIEKKKEQVENEKVANDDSTHQAQASDGKWYPYPNRSKEERAQARARANRVRDEIGELEGQRKTVPAERSTSAAPQVSSSRNSQYAGRRMSNAQLQKYATDKNISLDEARKRVQSQGVTIY
jgi:hypothetical protein